MKIVLKKCYPILMTCIHLLLHPNVLAKTTLINDYRNWRSSTKTLDIFCANRFLSNFFFLYETGRLTGNAIVSVLFTQENYVSNWKYSMHWNTMTLFLIFQLGHALTGYFQFNECVYFIHIIQWHWQFSSFFHINNSICKFNIESLSN